MVRAAGLSLTPPLPLVSTAFASQTVRLQANMLGNPAVAAEAQMSFVVALQDLVPLIRGGGMDATQDTQVRRGSPGTALLSLTPALARPRTPFSPAPPRTCSPPPPPPSLSRLRYMMAEGRRGELDLVDLLHDFFSVLLAYSATHVFSVGGGARLERAKRGWFAEQQRLAVEDPMDRERNLGDMVTAATMARITEEARRAQAILHGARQTRPSPIASRQAADDLFADLFSER